MQENNHTTTNYEVHERLRRERELRYCAKWFAVYAERHGVDIMGRPKRIAQVEHLHERR